MQVTEELSARAALVEAVWKLMDHEIAADSPHSTRRWWHGPSEGCGCKPCRQYMMLVALPQRRRDLHLRAYQHGLAEGALFHTGCVVCDKLRGDFVADILANGGGK